MGNDHNNTLNLIIAKHELTCNQVKTELENINMDQNNNQNNNHKLEKDSNDIECNRELDKQLVEQPVSEIIDQEDEVEVRIDDMYDSNGNLKGLSKCQIKELNKF